MTDLGGLMLFTVIHTVGVGLSVTRDPDLQKKNLNFNALTSKLREEVREKTYEDCNLK